MSKWREKFNALSPKVRQIGVMVTYENQIIFLRTEKIRLAKRYNKSIKEIDSRIANLKRWIKEEG